MTISENSIGQTADVLIDIFGDAAPAAARERMADYPGGSEMDGWRFWSAVAEAAESQLERARALEESRPSRGPAGAFGALRALLPRGHG